MIVQASSWDIQNAHQMLTHRLYDTPGFLLGYSKCSSSVNWYNKDGHQVIEKAECRLVFFFFFLSLSIFKTQILGVEATTKTSRNLS